MQCSVGKSYYNVIYPKNNEKAPRPGERMNFK